VRRRGPWTERSAAALARLLARPETPGAAAQLSGLAWLVVAVTTVLALPLPGGTADPLWLVLGLSAGAAAAGIALLRLAGRVRAPAQLPAISTAGLLGTVAALAATTGGRESPVPAAVLLVVVVAAIVLPARQAVVWVGAAAAVLALPLAYDMDGVDREQLLRELVVAVPALAAVMAVVVVLRGLLARRSREAQELQRAQRTLAVDQSSLRRVATAVAAGLPPQAIFALVSAEAGRLLDAEAAGIVRFDGSGARAVVLGTWAAPGYDLPAAVGDIYPLSPDDPLLRMRRSGEALAVHDLAEWDPNDTRRFGWRSLVAAPVHTANRPWGAIVLADRAPGAFSGDAADRLRDFSDLVATAIANAEDRARLETQAGADALTGLMNHRAFRDRLVQEVARAQRHGRPLSVGVVDVDAFESLNDQLGVDEADTVLAEIAHALRDAVRDEDVVARLAGDGFGVIFVESDPHEAYAAADRARGLVAGTSFRHRTSATVSAGLCDLDLAASPEDLLRRAGAALARAKAAGGNRCWRYDPAVVDATSSRLRTEELDRWQSVLGLRALARTIDAKDPTTQEHSERVASLAGRLAEVRRWSEEDVALLREAALLHDVGKIGVPDEILLKPGPLDEDEWTVMREHATLGARIVADVLDETQIAWIASHHERPDGRGYPLGIDAAALPEGAALLAMADAWDVMTRSRWYAARKSVDEAFAECRELSGRQFTEDAFAALEVLLERKELTPAAARMHSPG
jgi:diguanylate cyclase (GGDEF)-like protein/putative nucleotidyltransferase with HDIG domain